jgi:hypothetical protein
MYRPYSFPAGSATSNTATPKRYIDAISDGLRQGMRKHPNLVIMGQDIAEYGGAFKITQGFVEEFGKAGCVTRPFANRALWAQVWGWRLMATRPLLKCSLPILLPAALTRLLITWPKPITAGRRPLIW